MEYFGCCFIRRCKILLDIDHTRVTYGNNLKGNREGQQIYGSVNLGKRLHEEVRLNYSRNGEVTDGITRTNGDTYLHIEAIQQI